VIRVLLADDHEFVRSTLVELLTSSDGITVVAECSDGDEVVAAAERAHPDVLILDLAMPRLTGLQAARALLAVRPEARIILLTAALSTAAVREAQEIGLVGYLLKGEEPAEFVQHVRAVAAGGTAWSATALASVRGSSQDLLPKSGGSDYGERRRGPGTSLGAAL
jgi:DNA-binding NarL/FixJ family response regulator